MIKTVIIGAAMALTATAASAANDVLVEIHGDVWGNQFSVSDLANVNPGESMTISFELDSTNYLNSASFPTRGYTVDLSTFSVDFSGGTSVGAQNPQANGPAYFVIRNDDPAVDGFFMANNVDFPWPYMNLDQVGQIGQTNIRASVTYGNDPLSSLDILGALGTWDYTGLTVFGMGIGDDFFEDVLGIDFVDMEISYIPAPASLALLVPGALAIRRRR